MSRRRCLTSIASFEEGRGVGTECSADRLSDLPEEIAHNILSLLTFRDLTYFASLSKRCRELYLSTPRLNFSLLGVKTSTCDEWSRLLDSVDRFLNLRGLKKLHHLGIRWSVCHHRSAAPCFCNDEKGRIIPWIENALRCNVEVLDLNISLAMGTLQFPPCIFLCGSLRTLSVSMLHGTIKAPSLACLSNLECLKLAHVAIDDGFFKWISLSCKCIKNLCLERVCGERDITIESASLKSFSILTSSDRLRQLKICGEKLEDMHIEWSSRWCNSLSIFASNLKYLEWNGNTFVNHQSWVLEKAENSLWSGADREDGRALDLLCSIRRIKALTLDENAIMALFKKGSVSIPPLDDVSYLCLNIGSFIGKLVLPLVSLLRGMPNLNTLNMNSSPSCFPYRKTDCSGYDMKYWKSQNLPFVSQLKEVTIELSRFSCSTNPVEFSRFILEHARNLEKMVIVHTHRFAKASHKKLNESKKSSNAQVVFEEVGRSK